MLRVIIARNTTAIRDRLARTDGLDDPLSPTLEDRVALAEAVGGEARPTDAGGVLEEASGLSQAAQPATEPGTEGDLSLDAGSAGTGTSALRDTTGNVRSEHERLRAVTDWSEPIEAEVSGYLPYEPKPGVTSRLTLVDAGTIKPYVSVSLASPVRADALVGMLVTVRGTVSEGSVREGRFSLDEAELV
jgi:hypothetical protein